VVLVSASGDAASDSLRAYTIPSQEAVPISPPLAIEGSITAIASDKDNSALMIVRVPDQAGTSHEEVMHVTALCN